MLITISLFLGAIALAVVSSLTFFPVQYGYDFYKPILMFLAGYIGGIVIWWILIWLFGRFVNTNINKPKQSAWSRFWMYDGCKFLMFHAGIILKVTGKYKLPKTKYLLVCNHRSNFDPLTLMAALHREKFAFVTKASNYKIPLFTQFMKGLNFMPVDRTNHLQSLEMFKRGTEMLQNGVCNVVVYPEGTRQTSDVIGPFHEGVFNIAMHARVPIVVATTKGTETVQHNFFRRFSKVRIDILGVYNYEDYRAMTAKSLSDKIHNIMEEHLERIDVQEYVEKYNETKQRRSK